MNTLLEQFKTDLSENEFLGPGYNLGYSLNSKNWKILSISWYVNFTCQSFQTSYLFLISNCRSFLHCFIIHYDVKISAKIDQPQRQKSIPIFYQILALQNCNRHMVKEPY